MLEKPAPKPDDDTYSDEEAARRTEAMVRGIIGMKLTQQIQAAKPRVNQKPKSEATE